MDALLTALGQKAPELGVGGLVIMLIVLLLRRESGTESRHSAEMKRITSAHDEELAEIRADVKELREKNDELERALDKERQERRRVEDELAAVRRGGAT